MISEKDKKTILTLAKQYSASKVILFGSCARKGRESNDIDLAVEGVSPSDFYRFYGDLIFSLSKPVDVVDLAHKSKFTRLISQEGVILYGVSS